MFKIIQLNEEEMDWLDNGNGFCALLYLPEKEYDEISYNIMLKIRNAYDQVESTDENKYSLALTQEETEKIFDIMRDLIADDYNWMNEDLTKILPQYREERIDEFKEQLALTNSIFKKLEKPVQTFKSLEKHLNDLEAILDEEKDTTNILDQDVLAYTIETYKDSCRLIARSDGKVKYIYKPSFEECLQFLFYKVSKGRIWRFFFNIDLEISAILKRWSNKDKIDKLMQGKSVEYKQWSLTWIKGYMFIIKRRRNVVRYIDLSNIFHLSLPNASKKYLNKDHNDFINVSKLWNSLSYWDNNLNSIVEYCFKKCILTKELGLLFLRHLGKANVDLTKTLLSAGSLSRRTYKNLDKYFKD